MLTKDGYRSRLIDKDIKRNLEIFGAISLEGPKWCGKTWTALNFSNSAVFLNDPGNNFQNKRYAEMDVDLVLDKEPPELLDEWQVVPSVWDAVRFRCDQDKNKGKYILTGSATPVTDQIYHSGAGRICRMNMYTMSLSETGESSGEVSLKSLFTDEVRNQPVAGTDLDQLAHFIIRGGWPASITMTSSDASLVPKSYLNDVILHDISSIDGVDRSQNKMEALIRSLARNESSLASGRRLLADISDGSFQDNSVSKNTLTDYLDVLHRLFITDDLPAFSANIRSSNRVGVAVKRHFTDVSLAAAALGLTNEMLMQDLNTFGLLFESLCLHELRVYINSLGGKLYHFRDNTTGLEIDAIVELPNGDYGAIEIKLGTNMEEEAARNLLRFSELTEKKPIFLAVITGLGKAVLKRADGVYTFPITSLCD